MKKCLLFPVLFFVVNGLFAQQDGFTRLTDSVNYGNRIQGSFDTIRKFYAAYRLCFDSVKNPLLFVEAYDWMGTHYRYEGNNHKGIDCSGFTKVLYSAAYDKDLSGGSANLFSMSEPINKSALKEGDMVFFKIKRGRISHVGVYLGNNKFVHASVKGGVMINDLDEAYYKKYFYKGGRTASP
jgi:lipoprotein Spr